MCGCGGKGHRNVIGNSRRSVAITPQQMSARNKAVKPTESRLKEMKKAEEKNVGISLARREILRKHRLAVQRSLGK